MPGKFIGFIIGWLSITAGASAQQNGDSKLTAGQIIQRAIDSSGGDIKLDAIHSAEYISRIVTAGGDTLSFAVKRKDFNKYYISSLSLGYVNTTKIYNNGRAVQIKDEVAQSITDARLLEELLLQCYISIDYGYKKLGYKLNRLDDQKFENFDCFVVMAESPLGSKTLNFYDKKTGHNIMTIYPSQNKAVFIDFYQAKGITIASRVLMVDTKDKITESVLEHVNYDNSLDTNWFTIPESGSCKAPEIFKTGIFRYINSDDGSIITREKDGQVEMINGAMTAYKITWTGNSDYLLYRLKNPSAPPADENIEFIKARITAWKGNKYYCHYITLGNVGGTCAFEKME